MKIAVRLTGKKFLKAKRLIFTLITKKMSFAKNMKKPKEMRSASGHLVTLFNIILKDKRIDMRMSRE